MRWVAVASSLLAFQAAQACITLPSAGKAPVSVAGETAVIVWDPKTKTEHFIRTATFNGVSGPMGFLVPTPSVPRLKSLDAAGWGREQAMQELEGQIAPRIVTKKRTVYRLGESWGFEMPAKVASKGLRQLATASLLYLGDGDDVMVLDRSRVGNYDTAVLRADRADALLGWLKKNGFESDARLEGWLAPYVEKGWAITAFRFAPKGPSFTSEPVCLSFQTDRPFYPYREPEAKEAPASRSLRVYLVAPGRRTGALDKGAWPTTAEYSAPLANRALGWLTAGFDLPDEAFRGQWLTSFLDKRAVRPDSELYFDLDKDQAQVEPPPVVKIVDDPVDVPRGLAATVVGVPGLLVFGLVRRVRRK